MKKYSYHFNHFLSIEGNRVCVARRRNGLPFLPNAPSVLFSSFPIGDNIPFAFSLLTFFTNFASLF